MSARSGAGASREGSRPEGGGVGFDINAQVGKRFS